MKKNEVIEFINLLESNLNFYKNRVSELEEQLRRIDAFKKGWVLPNPLPESLFKEEFDVGEINTAYQRTLTYEGIEKNGEGAILMTFLQFLNKSHHSLCKDFTINQ